VRNFENICIFNIPSSWGLQINFGKTEYLTLDLGARIVTETGQINAVNKFKYMRKELAREEE
jgi:hypothetical protein